MHSIIQIIQEKDFSSSIKDSFLVFPLQDLAYCRTSREEIYNEVFTIFFIDAYLHTWLHDMVMIYSLQLVEISYIYILNSMSTTYNKAKSLLKRVFKSKVNTYTYLISVNYI